MEFKTCWEELGISPTSDKKKIRQAYARRSSQCHPEEHPEEWRRLHDAYEAALDASKYSSDDAEHDTSSHSSKPPSTEIPNLEQLIHRGMEKDAAGRTDYLMGKIRFLHENTPSGVDIYTSNMYRTMDRWTELFDSELFFRCQWQTDFLTGLNGWLQEHLTELNRAEVISFYRVYRLNQGQEEEPQSSDTQAALAVLRETLLSLKDKFQSDLTAYAGMPAPPAPDPVKEIHRQKSRRNTLLCIFCICLLLLVTIPLYLSRKFLSREAADPSTYSAAHYLQYTPEVWLSDNLFTRAFPDGYPLTRLEAQSSELAGGDQFLINLYLKENLHPNAAVECLREATLQQPAIYQVTPDRAPAVTYRLYIEKTDEETDSCRLLASTYIPEIFLAFARQNQIPGRVWVDDSYEVHIAFLWGDMENRSELDEAMLDTYDQFCDYHYSNDSQNPDDWTFTTPPVNLTVVYGNVDSNMDTAWLNPDNAMTSADIESLPRTYTRFTNAGITKSHKPE